jgi:hypothetical protein
MLCDQTKQALLQIKLAATIDGGLLLIQPTYRLEGHRQLVFTCFEEVNKVFQAIKVAHFPYFNGVAERLSQGQNTIKQQLVSYGLACVKLASAIKFGQEIKPVVDAFKAAQLLWPHKVNYLSPDSSSVESFKAFHFYQDNTLLNRLKAELPCYLSSC